MFGGNPGGKENRNGKLRLGDFWRLELIRQANTDLERLLLKDIRISRFREKSANPKDALTFLQQDVSRCIDHRDVEEQKQFQMLAAQLFNQVPNSNNVHIREGFKKKFKKIMENSIIGGEGVGSARVIFHIQFLFFFPNGIKINFRQGFFFMYRGGPPLGLLKPPPPP